MNKRLFNYFVVFICALFFLSCGQITGHSPRGVLGGGSGYSGGAVCGVWQQNINSTDYQILTFSAEATYTKETQLGNVSGTYEINDTHIKFITTEQTVSAGILIEDDMLTLEFSDGDIQKYYKF